MHPLADRNDPIEQLKAALSAKEAEARAKWTAFEEFRDKHGETGLADDEKKFKHAEGLHQDYSKTADECDKLRDQLIQALDSKAHGSPRRLTSITDAFLKQFGGIAELKAFTSGGAIVPAWFDERIRTLPQRQLLVRALIPTRQVDSDTCQYVRQTVLTNNAAPTDVGALKPTSVMTAERVSESVRTIAHLSEPLDRSLLMDYDDLAQWIDGQLRLGVLMAEENQILNGNGTAPNLRGILNTAGLQTQARGADSHADAIFKAITKCRIVFAEPDGIVMHPSDFQTVRLSKTADGDYQTAPVTADDGERLFGIDVVQSPVIAQGTALVGNFAEGAVVFDREQARITFAETGGLGSGGAEIFSRNLVVWRGESRIAFGVIRANFFTSVTGL